MAERAAEAARTVEGDELPVEPGERAGADIQVTRPLEFQGRPRPQDTGYDFLRVFPDRDRQHLAWDDQLLPIGADAPDEDMGVRIVGVPVIHRQPLEAGPDMAFEARHGLADERTELAEIGAILGADDEPEVTLVDMPAQRGFSRIERVAGLVIEGLIATMSLTRQIPDRCVDVLLGRRFLSARWLSLIADVRLVLPRGALASEIGHMGPERLCLPCEMGHEPGLHHHTALGDVDRSGA